MYVCDKYKEKRVWGNITSALGSFANEWKKLIKNVLLLGNRSVEKNW
jgi:hypothetical protein